MDKKQAENKLFELMTEAVKILKEFEPNSNYLTMVYLGDIGNGRVNIYNDAFRYDDVKPIDFYYPDFNDILKKKKVVSIYIGDKHVETIAIKDNPT